MKYVFKEKPIRLSADKTLATNRFGDIMLFKGKLIIPTGKWDKLEYSFLTNVWSHYSGGIKVSTPKTKILYSNELLVKDIDFFDYLVCDDKLEFMKEYYRDLREVMCYPIINRGKLWYDHLTLAQASELNDWYEEWLDITETHTIPITPTWINNKLNKIEPEELL